MALENMFIASAVTGASLTGVFLYLFHTARDETWRDAFLASVFLSLIYAVDMVYIGFAEIIVHADAASTTFTVLHILMYVLYAMFIVLVIRILVRVLGMLGEVLLGLGYGKEN